MNDLTALPLPTIRVRTLGAVPIMFDFRGVLLSSVPGVNDGWSAPWTATQKDLLGACAGSQYRGVALYAMQANLPAEVESVDIELDINGLTRPLRLLNTGRDAVFAVCSWWDGDTAKFGNLADYYRFACPFLPLQSPNARKGFLLADHLIIDDTTQSAVFADLFLASMGVNIACLSSLTGNPSITASNMADWGFQIGWQCRQGQDDAPMLGSDTTPETWAAKLVKSFTDAKWPLGKLGLIIVSDEPSLFTKDPEDAIRLADHMAHCMAALRALVGPDCLLCFNANNASLRSWAPDGQAAIDPFVFSRLTKDDPNVILWTEDWMQDQASQLITWPFLSSVAISEGKRWGGYCIGQTAGDHYGDRIRSMIDRGASVAFAYQAGPDFLRVQDSYWQNRESVWNQVKGVFA